MCPAMERTLGQPLRKEPDNWPARTPEAGVPHEYQVIVEAQESDGFAVARI